MIAKCVEISLRRNRRRGLERCLVPETNKPRCAASLGSGRSDKTRQESLRTRKIGSGKSIPSILIIFAAKPRKTKIQSPPTISAGGLKPGSPRGDAGQGKKSIGARRNRGERLILVGERENRGEDDGNHDRAKQSREIRIDVGDPDFRENRGHGGKNCRQQSPEEPRRGPGLQAAPLAGAASKPA